MARVACTADFCRFSSRRFAQAQHQLLLVHATVTELQTHLRRSMKGANKSVMARASAWLDALTVGIIFEGRSSCGQASGK